MDLLSKDMIDKWILPHLPAGKRGFATSVPVVELVECIFYRLKTGCQWRQLPTRAFFKGRVLSWNSVFYYWNKWSKQGCWHKIWIELLKANREHLDLSSLQLDGSHTPAKNGGQAIAYQARKAGNTTNALFVCDNQGVMLAMATPQAGNHHDLFEIQTLFGHMCALPKEAGMELEGLFLNADPGFDAQALVQACDKEQIFANIKPNPRNKHDPEPYRPGTHVFDEKLYGHRSVIEHANAWIDSFKSLLVRFEFTLTNWVSLHLIAFCVIFLRKISKNMKV